jgi:hypothetical protein
MSHGHRFVRLRPARTRADFAALFREDFAFRFTRSGRRLLPVSRFHSSKVSGDAVVPDS